MLVGIVSDIHDHLGLLDTALGRLQAVAIDALICCGDLCSPFVVTRLAEGTTADKLYIVFGNNDGDRFRITTAALRYRHADGSRRVDIGGESSRDLELGGRQIFVHHFDDVGAHVAATGRFDLVCYGHNHAYLLKRHPGATLELNPGAIMGWSPTQGDVPSTFAVYDTARGEARIYDTTSGAVIDSA